MPPIARAAPRPATSSRQTIPVIVAADRMARRLQPIQSHLRVTTTKGAADRSAAPCSLGRISYFRLVIAVRSAESLTIPAAPHQLEPKPNGLIEVALPVWLAVKSLVKALQSPLERLVSE